MKLIQVIWADTTLITPWYFLNFSSDHIELLCLASYIISDTDYKSNQILVDLNSADAIVKHETGMPQIIGEPVPGMKIKI